MTMGVLTPDSIAWSHTFDSSKRHCWTLANGKRILEGTLDRECHKDHTNDPKVVGQVEWMRFIHATQDLIDNKDNPFLAGEDTQFRLRLGENFEAYYKGEDLVVTITKYTWSTGRVAVIRLYDPTYKDLFNSAMMAVEASYE